MSLKKVPNNGIWCHRMATVCREKMDAKSAVRFALAGVQFDQERFFAQHPRVANRRMLFGQVLILDGQVNEARKQFSLALASRTKFLDGDNPLVAETRRVLETLK